MVSSTSVQQDLGRPTGAFGLTHSQLAVASLKTASASAFATCHGDEHVDKTVTRLKGDTKSQVAQQGSLPGLEQEILDVSSMSDFNSLRKWEPVFAGQMGFAQGRKWWEYVPISGRTHLESELTR